MAFQLDDYYSGVYQSSLVAHLASTVPAQPYVLVNFSESAWMGYRPCPVTVLGRQPSSLGYNLVVVSAFFGNDTDQQKAGVCLYLTGNVGNGVELFGLGFPPGVQSIIIPPGGLQLTASLNVCEGA